MAHLREPGDIPPTFRIDLSLPPSERYVVLASTYRQRLRSLIDIFEELISSLEGIVSPKWVYRIAPIILRKLYTREETQEIKGISRVTGIDLYILVSLNVFLDLLMGCTSGAALTKLPHDTDAKMLHFRTLDWDMDELRRLIVKLEYVRGPESNTVIATSVTYVGFVGVLTGVRRGLSISLNFRPNHNSSRFLANYRFYGSHLLVLLGMRRSISSLLRKYLLSPDLDHIQSRSWRDRMLRRKGSRIPSKSTLDWIAGNLPRVPTTAAYLIMCDGNSAIVFEKDHRSAVIQRSSSFVVATNSDLAKIPLASQKEAAIEYDKGHDDRIIDPSKEPLDLDDLIFLSGERRAHMQDAWEKKVKEKQDKSSTSHDYSTAEPILSQPSHQSGPTMDCRLDVSLDLYGDNQVTALPSEVTEWINGYPVTNEMTHFAAIMDPTLGQVAWLRRYLEPPIHNDNR